MTGLKMLAFVRDLIEETTEAQNLDDKIQRALNSAFHEWVSKIHRTYSEYYFRSCSVTLSSGERSIALPNGSLYDSAPKCTGLIFGLEDSDGYAPSIEGFDQFYIDNTGNPTNIVVMGNNIMFSSKPSSDITYTLYYYYIPKDIDVTDNSDEIDFPPLHHGLLCIEAAIISKIRLDGNIIDLVTLRDSYAITLKNNLGRREVGSPEEIPSGFDLKVGD